MKHIFLSFISLLFFVPFSKAQTTSETTNDTLVHKEKFGLRVGIDLFKPARTLFDEDYSGFEIMGDYRVYKNYYAALELGNEQKTTFDDNLTSKGDGSYFKLGFDYNAHNNWAGLNNMIFAGLRYGLSSFSQELIEYQIATVAPFFPPDIRTEPIVFDGLTVHWVEVIVGIKTEIFNNLYLSLNLQLKNRVSETKPENFDNLFIPGFGRTYENSKFGAGFGYGVSYLIPIVKK
ncbi:MAG: DUF6048 family protein [Flavobacteriaceae bacterium]|nr:DUF6048 family protein [Flavobacteriaceae bacterium]